MSDYLWDKSGAPDAEVERLEELLGSLRHRPSALELPADATSLDPLRPRLFSTARLFNPARFFDQAWPSGTAWVAAALLLAFLVGATIFLRARVTTTADDRAATHDAQQSHEQPRATRQEPSSKRQESDATQQESAATRQDSDATRKASATARHETEPVAGSSERRDAKVAVEKLAVEKIAVEKVAVKDSTPGRRQGVRLAALTKRQQRLATTVASGASVDDRGAVEALRAESPGGTPSLLESTRLMAKEQLVYALRLTGAKLREVRRRTQGLEDSKPAFDARHRIK
jgi:hypothetical protein